MSFSGFCQTENIAQQKVIRASLIIQPIAGYKVSYSFFLANPYSSQLFTINTWHTYLSHKVFWFLRELTFCFCSLSSLLSTLAFRRLTTNYNTCSKSSNKHVLSLFVSLLHSRVVTISFRQTVAKTAANLYALPYSKKNPDIQLILIQDKTTRAQQRYRV